MENPSFGLLLIAAATSLLSSPALGSTIVFDSNRNGGSKIYTMTIDGAVTGPIGTLPGTYSDPVFGPNNRQVVFSYTAPNTSTTQIYVMNSDGSQLRALTAPGTTSWMPQITRGGQIVYWRGSPTNVSNLYIMNFDGSHQRPLSLNTSGYVTGVSVGSDGSVAFAGQWIPGDSHQSAQLYVTSIDGGVPNRITDSSDTFDTPGWSPDSHKIAYANHGTLPLNFSGIVPNYEPGGIYVANMDGRGAHRIARIDFSVEFGPPTSFGVGPGRETVSVCSAPSFSSDGIFVTYAVQLGDGCQIYLARSDGSGVKRLSSQPGTSNHPSFSH